jgi:hypothetical protein
MATQTALDRLLTLHPPPWELPLPGRAFVIDAQGFVVRIRFSDREVAAGVIDAVNVAAEFRQVVDDFHEEVLGIEAASAACDEPAIGFLPPEVSDGR